MKNALDGLRVDGAILRGRRLALGMTQREIALLVDVRPETISRWERGVRPAPRMYDLALRYYEESMWPDWADAETEDV